MKNLIPLLVFFFCSFSMAAAADPIEGKWMMSDGSVAMKLTIEEGKLVGRVTEVNDKKGRDFTFDKKNPDPKLRGRKVIGMPIVWGFHKKGDQWEGGYGYLFSKGKTYRGKIWMEGKDKMFMRGFIGVELLGKSAEWDRVK